VTKLGYEQLKRHSLRHTGLTWMADAGVPVHVLRKIAGHADLSTTQGYLHPDRQSVAVQVSCCRSTCGPKMVPSSGSSDPPRKPSQQLRAYSSLSG